MHTPEPRRPSGVHPRVPVLVLGKGVTALGAVRALGRRGTPLFVAGNPGSLVTGSRWYRRLPAEFLDDPSRIDAALEALDVPRLVLLPCSDAWAIAVSRLRPDLQTRFPASVSSPDIVRRFTDKGRFAEMVVKLGIPHPRTILLLEPGALDGVPDDAFEASFLKPVNSGNFAAQYGVKAVRPKSREQARTFLAGALEKGLPLMLQEFIPGPPTLHVFVEGFIDRKGRVCGMLARRRLRMFPSDFGNSTFTESIPLEEVRGAEDPSSACSPKSVTAACSARSSSSTRATASSRSSRSTRGPGGSSTSRPSAASTSATWRAATPSGKTSSPSRRTPSAGAASICGGTCRAAERRKTAGWASFRSCARGSAPSN